MNTRFKFAALGVLLGWSSVVMAEESLLEAVFTPFRQKEFVPVDNKQYIEECGSCHFAYQPGLLPSKSWEKLLDDKALAEHFGVNAQFDADARKAILEYTVANAADKSYHKRSRKIAIATEKVEAPLRITEISFMKRKHKDIPTEMVKGNKAVKSLSYCNACHTQADKGIFDDSTIRIPNYPDWHH